MSRAGLRVDLYRSRGTAVGWSTAPPMAWRWRLWSSSSIIAASSEGYSRRNAAIHNLESVTGGRFEQVSTPDFPTPFGLLTRQEPDRESLLGGSVWRSIPVRLVGS